MADVVAYEEKDPETLASFKSGYPRFFRNPIISELSDKLTTEGLKEATDPLLPDLPSAKELCKHCDLSESAIKDQHGCYSVHIDQQSPSLERAKYFLQHTGSALSSREAEALLQSRYSIEPFRESRSAAKAEENYASIQNHLHRIYGTASPKDVFIFRSGMNAFCSGFQAINRIQQPRGRTIWIQLGWLYVDTVRVLEKFSPDDAPPVKVMNVVDLDELQQILKDQGPSIAGIVAEVPTNPLVETPDLERLQSLARRFGVALLVDPTLASPHNIHVLPYTDLHINSLTKYAAAEGDIMMGALAINPHSAFYDDLYPLLSEGGSRPGAGDLARMALQIQNYANTIATVNKSTPIVADFLEKHPSVSAVRWAYRMPEAYNYRWLQHLEAGPGAIISIILKNDPTDFYDRCNLVKSPSFGTRYTMVCPFMYLAHYDLVRSKTTRANLISMGLHPELLRLSVGMEPVDAILEELDRCL